jgi:hypothetical protein
MSNRFDDNELRTAYQPRLREARATRGPDCPEPAALLAALNGEGTEAERLHTLDHALSCPACRPELALLHAVSRDPLTQAGTVSKYTWRRFVPLAAAASIAVVAGIVGIAQWRSTDDETMRGGSGQPALIAPASASSPAAGPVTFVWHRVEGALNYRLEVLATDGTVLYSAAAADTTVTAQLGTVQPGEQRWLVRAQMDDGSERSSEMRVLRLQ